MHLRVSKCKRASGTQPTGIYLPERKEVAGLKSSHANFCEPQRRETALESGGMKCVAPVFKTSTTGRQKSIHMPERSWISEQEANHN